MKNGYQKYKQTSVQSASREKLLLLMYEGAIKYMKRAIMSCEANDIAERGFNIGKAYDVIMELSNTLDHTVGAEVAQNLEQLYLFICEQLTQANISGDAKPIKDSLKIVETLYDGWVQAIDQLKKNDKAV